MSALTTILLDTHNYIPTADNRLLRRIIRDYNYRGYSAADTIRRWPSVQAGEEKWIFPHQEQADAMFNSALLFSNWRSSATRPFRCWNWCPRTCRNIPRPIACASFCAISCPWRTTKFPPTSLLREFNTDGKT